jgi:hypothetical protein
MTKATTNDRLVFLCRLFFSVSLFLATLWDYYYGGFRIFDFVGFTLIIALFYLLKANEINVSCGSRELNAYCILLILLVSSAILGFFNETESLKNGIGLVFVCLFFILFYIWPICILSLKNTLNCILGIHAFCLFCQFSNYYVFGSVLNFHALIGVEPRLVAAFFRPAGLFQEPAHYCLNMFMLLTLRSRLNDNWLDRYALVVLISMVLTLSLWGLIAAIAYVGIRRKIAMVYLFAISAALVSGLIAFYGLDGLPIVDTILQRITNPGNDGSANARYAGLGGVISNWASDYSVWFGQGANTSFNATGSSGLSYALTTFGILGLCLFIFIYGKVFRASHKYSALIAIAFVLTATPIFTFAFFWVWLALLARPLRSKFDIMAQPPRPQLSNMTLYT